MLNQFFAGAATVSLLVIAMFFFRFWRRTRDRLFLYFASAFLILMAERVIRASMEIDTEWTPYVYMVRLTAFVVIIVGVIDKNRHT